VSTILARASRAAGFTLNSLIEALIPRKSEGLLVALVMLGQRWSACLRLHRAQSACEIMPVMRNAPCATLSDYSREVLDVPATTTGLRLNAVLNSDHGGSE
jgi:hypothetical protein